mgnify:FL=1
MDAKHLASILGTGILAMGLVTVLCLAAFYRDANVQKAFIDAGYEQAVEDGQIVWKKVDR